MAMADCLYECLCEARLEQYYPKLEAQGITMAETLSRLTMNDYTMLGISSMEDKKRLFRLIQIIRAVQGRGQKSQRQRPQARQQPPQNEPPKSQSKTLQPRQENPERVKPNQSSSPDSNKENIDFAIPPPRERTPPRLKTKGAGTPEKKRTAVKQVPSPAKSDASVTSTKGLNIVVQDTPGKTSGPAFIERIVHTSGYNYGLPNSVTKPKASSALSSQTEPSTSEDTKIKVCVRKRPLSRREMKKKDGDVVRVDDHHTVVLMEPKVALDLTKFTQEHAFVFDEVFHEIMTNKEVYERTAKHLIDCVFSGGKATCFVYGQTGAGKTHTIMGNLEVPGLYLLAAQDMFNKVQSVEGLDIVIWVSYFEIYCGQLFDLLNKRKKLHVREDGSQRVNIAGLSEIELNNVQTLMEAVEYGNKARSTGSSGVNPDSSRSHAILQIELRTGSRHRIGKISFIDLAGSERACDATDADRQNRLEGAEINQSLLALKECIRALDQESRHTPFRQSKLTHILKDSFIGNCKTCMIANISPCQSASENTLNTLRYADRVKELRKELSPKSAQREEMPTSARKSAVIKEFPTGPKSTPSLFHPSTIPLSSTPVRPRRVEAVAEVRNDAANGYLQFESPVCGHKIRPRKLASTLAEAQDYMNDLPVKDTPSKNSAIAKEIINVSASSELNASSRISKQGTTKDVTTKLNVDNESDIDKVKDEISQGARKGAIQKQKVRVEPDIEKSMEISVASTNVSMESRGSRAVKKTDRGPVRAKGASYETTSKEIPKNTGTATKSKAGPVGALVGDEKTLHGSPLNLSILKQGKFDKQTGLIARLEKAMEKTREALNRSLTSQDLIATAEMEREEVPTSQFKNATKESENEKHSLEILSKPSLFAAPFKSFTEVACNSPVKKEKISKMIRAQKENAKKISSVRKVLRTPTKTLENEGSEHKENKKECDLDTSQEVSPSKRRRIISPPEAAEVKSSTDFDNYLSKALHDTGNKRNKFQVYGGKFLPPVGNEADVKDSVVKQTTAHPVKFQNNGNEPETKELNVTKDAQKSPQVAKRSLLSEFKEDVISSDKSQIIKTFLSPQKVDGTKAGARMELINSFSPIKKFNGEKEKTVAYTMTDQCEKRDRSNPLFSCDISQDSTLTQQSGLSGAERSPDTRRPKLLDRETGDLYTMSQSPQKSPRMTSKMSPRVQHFQKPALGKISEATQKIQNLPTPDEFLKSLAGKRTSVRKNQTSSSDDEPKSERLSRPKDIVDSEPRSESGVIKKERSKWKQPVEKLEPKNPNILVRTQRPTWIKPKATKGISLTNILDDPLAQGDLDLENGKGDLIQSFYTKLLKYSAKDKMLKDRNSEFTEKTDDVRSAASDTALLKRRIPSGGKSDRDGPTEFSERVVPTSKTVTDSGVVIPRLSLESKPSSSTLKETDVETASIGTLDDVSSIASARSLPAAEEPADDDERQTLSEPLPPLPPVDLQKTACSAWKKTAPLKPKAVKAQGAAQGVQKQVTKKVTCTAPLRSEKELTDPLATFLPIHPYPVTPRSNDVLTAPKVITKIVVEEGRKEKGKDTKDTTSTSENLDDSEIIRCLSNVEKRTEKPSNTSKSKDALVNSLSTIGLALKQGKLNAVKELNKKPNSSSAKNKQSPLSKTLGFSSNVLSSISDKNSNKRNSNLKSSSERESLKSYSEKDPLRNTIGVSSCRYLKDNDQVTRSPRNSLKWREELYPTTRREKTDLKKSLEDNVEARKDLGASLRSTYDSVSLRSTLDSITTSAINGSTLRETTVRRSRVEYTSDVDEAAYDSHRARLKVISGHEEHLADITAMCRREMSLLKRVKHGEMSFGDYTNRMTDMLLIKLKSIEVLRNRIARCNTTSSALK